DKIKFSEAFQVFKTLLIYLEKENIKTCQLKLLPEIYTSLPNNEISYLLFKVNAALLRKDLTSVIDYTNQLSIDSSNRKRGIKKGIKNGLEVKEESDLSSFWNEILIPNLKFTHDTKPVHSAEEIMKLKEKFPNNIKQFNVYYNDTLVGGTTIFESNNVAHAQYISANTDKQKLGTLDFLFNYLINEKFKNKSFFDFGISNENQGQQINEGLLAWKESFGARSIVHEFYEIETKNHHLLNDLYL
ncbi:MAG: GNAT family N-acetyltransferase, partial [Flavobacteriaceae bacterium]|nr:GNAT family N-acetyltransferase [Flavobacteriaceae bacterium]